MIRRDYILRMIEEFIQAMARLKALKNGERWDEAAAALDEEFQRLLDGGARAAVRLSDTELLAKLVQGEPTQAVRHKTLMLVRLFSEAGETAAAQDRLEESVEYYLKALHLLLEVLARGERFEWPEFVPKIQALTAAVPRNKLPAQTQALLMQHYESSGEYAKAEDALFGLLEADPNNAAIVDFGLAFYRRLLAQTDAALSAGNLPRSEIQQSMNELASRRAS